MPTEIAKGISPEGDCSQNHRKRSPQFAQTGLPETAQALSAAAKQMKQTVSEFDRTAGQLILPYTGVAQQVRTAIDQIDNSISRAVRAHGEAAHRFSTEFLQDYKRSLFVITSLAALASCFLGFLLAWWIMPTSSERAAAAPAASVGEQLPMTQKTPASSNGIRKKRAATETRPSPE